MKSVTKRSGFCWITYIDIYAFSYHVDKLGENKVYSKLYLAMENIRGICEKHNIDSVHLSDSLFLVSFDSEHGNETLSNLLHCISHAQDELLDADFIPRGSVAYGSIEMSRKIIVGSAIIRAVRLEQQIGAPCVFLPLRELVRADVRPPWDFVYDISTKGGGLIRGLPILPHTLERLAKASAEQLDDALVNGPDNAAQALTALGEIINAGAEYQKRARPVDRRPSKKPRTASAS